MVGKVCTPEQIIKELRQQREIIKLQQEIADHEAGKEKLPDRVAALEKTVLHLQSLLNNAVDILSVTRAMRVRMHHCELIWEIPNKIS